MSIALTSFQCPEMAIFDTSDLTGSFQPMNSAASYTVYTGEGLEYAIKILKFYNGGTTGVTISYDGITNHDYFPPGSTFILDLQTNHSDNSAYGAGTLNGRQGLIIYGLGTAGVGNFYISAYT